MKVLLVSLLPLFACLLLPPSEVRSERDILKKKLKLGSVDDYFKPEYIKKTCKVCADIGGVDYNDCVAEGAGKTWCNMTIDEMRIRFNEGFEKGGSLWRKRSAEANYFDEPKNVWKICNICQNLFKVDSSACYTGQKKERHHCKNMVEEMPHTIERAWNNFTVPY